MGASSGKIKLMRMESSNDRAPNTAAALIAVGIIVLALAGLTLLGLALTQTGVAL